MAKNEAQRKKVSGGKLAPEDFLRKDPSGERDLKALRIWKEEVKALTGRRFTSMSDAIESIIEQVGKRMEASAEEKDFLRTALATDPILHGELQKQLNIQ